MPKFVRIQQQGATEVARQVTRELERGLGVVPMLGGYCVLSRDPTALGRLGEPYLLVSELDRAASALAETEPAYRESVLRVMSGPVVARFGAGQTPKALASEPLAREVLDGTGRELWFAVPEEESEPGELADELGSRAAIVVTGGPTGPGPTVVDFSSRPAQIDRRGKLAILDLEQALGETTRLGPDMVFSVLVVCTGNSCRSPMAHVLLADLLTGAPAFVYSAGTGAPVGAPATAAAIEVMREPGLDLTRHRAQQLEPGMVRAADLILVMEALHRDYVVELVPEARGRTRLLLSYLGSDEEIDDPVGRPIEVYRRTLVRMRPALERVAAEIRQRTSGQPGSMKAEERRTKTVE